MSEKFEVSDHGEVSEDGVRHSSWELWTRTTVSEKRE